MSINQWLLFVLSTVFISATPGPNMLLAFQFGLQYGLRRTVITLLGLTAGLLILLSLSILGVATLSSRAPLWFEAGKCVGALYLAYLGWQTWRAPAGQLNSRALAIQPTPARLFRTGLAVSLSNPKAILFFAAFFPKFVQADSPVLPQYGILMLTFFAIEITWQWVYAASGRALAQWLQQGRRLLWLNRICGGVFVAIAASLLWDALLRLWPHGPV